jgi:hypothetical protein
MTGLWSEDMIGREKRRLRGMGTTGFLLYFVPVLTGAALRGQSPWELPHFHTAIPIVLLCLLPLAYFLMPMFDGVLVLGSVRPTTPRAALFVRCVIVDGIALLSVYLLLHSGAVVWPGVYWLAGLPAALGLLLRIRAYQTAMERIATGQTQPK